MKRLCLLLSLLLLPGCLGGCGSAPAPASEPGLCSYTACCYDVNSESFAGVEGVVLSFCTDESCTPVVSDETGAAVFSGPPTGYRVQIVSIPEGWEPATEESEWAVEPFGEPLRIPFAEVSK